MAIPTVPQIMEHISRQGGISGVFYIFLYKKINVEVRDLFKKARGPRGVIFPKYEPVASHGDPIQPRFSKTMNPHFSVYTGHVKLKLDV